MDKLQDLLEWHLAYGGAQGLNSIPEEDSLYEHSQESHSLNEQIFRIRNLDTGEELDVRDENKDNYPYTMARVMQQEQESSSIQEHCRLKRKINLELLNCVSHNDLQGITDLLDTTQRGSLTAQVNAKGLDNWTALHLAAVDGFCDACELLLSSGEGPDVDALTSMRRTPLHLACLHGHLEVVKVLLVFGGKLNATDNDNNTPLHCAAMRGHSSVVRWLLNSSPDIGARNCLNRTCLDVACNYEIYNDILCHYKEHSGYSRTPFYGMLLHNSRVDVISKLLLKGANRPSTRDLKTFNARLRLGNTVKSPSASTSDSSPPNRVGPQDFKGLSQLGKGSFGEVFLVEQKDSGELFALKVLRKDRVLGNNLLKYAFTERNILLKLDHPFIVRLNSSFQTPEKLVLVMDYCPNGDLGTHLSREKRFSESKAKFYLCEIILALHELHRHGIIFRDLKPENVVLDAEGHAKLTDFGLSKEGVEENVLAKSFCGSVAYLAPEMLCRAGHTRSVDWYLVGALFYEMLAGRPPYYSNNREQMFNNIQRAKLRLSRNITQGAAGFIKQLLQRDPSKRLGAGNSDGEELMTHPYCTDVDWDAVLHKATRPPEVSTLKKQYREVTNCRIFGQLASIPANQLAGWSFISPQHS